MLQKIYFMVFERYIPGLKEYDGISFLHQPMTSGQPLKIVQRHMAHPVEEKDGQTRVRRSVSAYVVACLAVITLIKDCYKRACSTWLKLV